MKNRVEESIEIIENEELVLLILFYSEGYYTLKTRLIKLLFLFKEIFPINEEYESDLDFFPFNYGPSLDYNEYELLISTLKNYEFIEIEEKTWEKYDSPLIKIKIHKEKENEILRMIEDILISEKPLYKIELIEKLCKSFPNIDNKILVQFVYYIREDFTEKSKIREEIFQLSKKKIQNKIIDLFKGLRIRYLDILLEYKESILKIFNISKSLQDFPIIKELLSNFHVGLKSNSLKITKNFIQNLDRMSLKDKKYHKLKLSLLDIFLKNYGNKWANEEVISVIIYILKSLSLSWPLENIIDREEFISLTSLLHKSNKSFYKPEETFSILEKGIPTDEEIQNFILKYERDLTYKRKKEDKAIKDEFGQDFTEDDDIKDEIIKKSNF
ncbi:MAG: hypothetical protein ACXACX_15360 [Candidatus Hodarchaeales archaeon]|jgi:hypothetical protein